MVRISIVRDGGWELSPEFPGDEDRQPPFRVLFRRFCYRDRLQSALWQDRQSMMEDTGKDAINSAFADEEAQAIASRLRDPETEESWTSTTVDELGGRSPAARSWLYELLYRPVFDELENGRLKKNWAMRLQLRIQILQLHLDLARAV